MINKRPEDIERYLVKKAVDIVNGANDFNGKNVQESLNILKEQLRQIYIDAHSDGFEIGFEEGLNQQLGIDL